MKNKTKYSFKFRVYPSKLEESKEGWVWIPPNIEVNTEFIEIRNPNNKKKIICEKRFLDDNYIRNHKTLQKVENCQNECIIMNEFYRNRLGIRKYSETREYVELEIREVKCPITKYLIAPLHHPNSFVRISITIGIISLAIGLLSIILSLLFRFL